MSPGADLINETVKGAIIRSASVRGAEIRASELVGGEGRRGKQVQIREGSEEGRNTSLEFARREQQQQFEDFERQLSDWTSLKEKSYRENRIPPIRI